MTCAPIDWLINLYIEMQTYGIDNFVQHMNSEITSNIIKIGKAAAITADALVEATNPRWNASR